MTYSLRSNNERLTTSDAAFLAYLNAKYDGHVTQRQLLDYFGNGMITRFVRLGVLLVEHGKRSERAYRLGPNAFAVLDFYFEGKELGFIGVEPAQVPAGREGVVQ